MAISKAARLDTPRLGFGYLKYNHFDVHVVEKLVSHTGNQFPSDMITVYFGPKIEDIEEYDEQKWEKYKSEITRASFISSSINYLLSTYSIDLSLERGPTPKMRVKKLEKIKKKLESLLDELGLDHQLKTKFPNIFDKQFYDELKKNLNEQNLTKTKSRQSMLAYHEFFLDYYNALIAELERIGSTRNINEVHLNVQEKSSTKLVIGLARIYFQAFEDKPGSGSDEGYTGPRGEVRISGPFARFVEFIFTHAYGENTSNWPFISISKTISKSLSGTIQSKETVIFYPHK